MVLGNGGVTGQLEENDVKLLIGHIRFQKSFAYSQQFFNSISVDLLWEAVIVVLLVKNFQ